MSYTQYINKRKYLMPVIEAPSKFSFKLNRKFTVIYIVFAFVAAFIIWASWYYFAPISKTGVCSSVVLKDASSFLAPEKVAQLNTIAMKIQKLRGYDKDVNCLYVLTTYYINAGDLQNSQLFMAKLNKVYDPKIGFSFELRTEGRDKKYLSEGVSFLELYTKQNSNNARGSATP